MIELNPPTRSPGPWWIRTADSATPRPILKLRWLRKVAAAEGVRLPEWSTFKRNLCRWESGTVTVSPFYEGLLGRLFGLPGFTANDTIELCYWCGRPGCQWCAANRCPDPRDPQCACPSCAAEVTEIPSVVTA